MATLLVANEAFAQLGGGFPGGGGFPAPRRGSMRGGDSGRSVPSLPERESGQKLFQTTLEELRVDLRLDAKQQVAWNAYADKIAALLNDLAREHSRGQPGKKPEEGQTAPKLLDQISVTAQNRATAVDEVVVAAKSLYGTLNPEQKAIADARLANVTSLALSQEETRARR